MIKPPLGLMPKFIWLENRKAAIEDAISRYDEANEPVPEDWVVELHLLEAECSNG